MRIALVVPEYPPYAIGGGGLVFESLAHAYTSYGHAVKVFAGWDSLRSWHARPAEEERQGVRLTRFPLIPVGRGVPFLRSIPPPGVRATVRLRRDLRAWKPDVAHVHGYGHAFVDVAARFLRRQRTPFIFTIHGFPRTQEQMAAPIRMGYSAYKRWGPQWILKKAAAVTAVSQAVAHEVDKATNITVVPNGLVDFRSASDADNADIRRMLQIPDAVPVIAGVGRLARSKGFDVLVRAFSDLPVPRAVCIIAGADAGEYGRLSALGRQCRQGLDLLLPGAMDRDRLSQLMSIASVLVIPSRDEPFGLVALEALASGLRVVASSVGGLPDFLRAPVAELVPPENPRVLAAAIMRALSRGPFGPTERRVADHVLTEYSWTRVAAQYTRLMSLAVDGSKATLSATHHSMTRIGGRDERMGVSNNRG